MESRRVIMLEFNELTSSLMDPFIQQGHLPNFERFRNEAHVYVTDAEEAQDNLEPWIQWVTVHSGLSYAEHKVFHLNDGCKLDQKCIWELVSDAGLPIWVCGSMNAKYAHPVNGRVLPDPWMTAAEPYPHDMLPYFRFVQRHVQEHTNVRMPEHIGDSLAFVAYMATHGLSASTTAAIIRHLIEERIRHNRWKRAALLDRLQWDVFSHYYQKLKPALSTFFLNSTAHYQHMYWRNLEPHRFQVQPSPNDQTRYRNAILFGYKQMDRLIGRFMDLAADDATLVFCTALSQQPCLKYERQGGKSLYRPQDIGRLLRLLGIRSSFKVSPVMSEEFHLYFTTEEDAMKAEFVLGALRLGNEPLMTVVRKRTDIFTGCRVTRQLPDDVALSLDNSGQPRRFFDLFYKLDGIKSGMHYPEGLLWIRTSNRKHTVGSRPVPLRAVAPTILQMLGLVPPRYMTAEPISLVAS